MVNFRSPSGAECQQASATQKLVVNEQPNLSSAALCGTDAYNQPDRRNHGSNLNYFTESCETALEWCASSWDPLASCKDAIRRPNNDAQMRIVFMSCTMLVSQHDSKTSVTTMQGNLDSADSRPHSPVR
jgi:hypothetical protein